MTNIQFYRLVDVNTGGPSKCHSLGLTGGWLTASPLNVMLYRKTRAIKDGHSVAETQNRAERQKKHGNNESVSTPNSVSFHS